MAQIATPTAKGDNGASRAEDLQADLAALRRDFAALTEHVAAMAEGGVRDAARGLADRGAKLRDTANTAAADAKHRGQAGIALVEGQVQAHPLVSILVAFGAGLVVSRLLVRDR